ncbi:hypothetical protein ACFPRL_28290 [Pseudoclavibacter helvolus]
MRNPRTAARSVRQRNSTPKRSRCSSMNRIISFVAGRVLSRKICSRL